MWASVGAVLIALTSMKINGPPEMIVAIQVGMTAFMLIGAALERRGS